MILELAEKERYIEKLRKENEVIVHYVATYLYNYSTYLQVYACLLV